MLSCCFLSTNFQVAPILFLLIEKLSVNLFGYGELSLRLFPHMLDIFSACNFYFFAKTCLRINKLH